MENSKELLKELMKYFGKEYLEEKKKRINRKDYKEIQRRTYTAIVWIISETRDILANDDLDDFQCVEAIVKAYGKIGLGCGGRHDF